jgi:hypothetical protein
VIDGERGEVFMPSNDSYTGSPNEPMSPSKGSIQKLPTPGHAPNSEKRPANPTPISTGWNIGDAKDPTPLPEWAVQKAIAALRIGMSVPEVEKHLVNAGLSPSTAEAVVTRVLSQHVQAQALSRGHQEPSSGPEQLMAGVVAAVAIVLGLAGGRPTSLMYGAVVIAFALWRIWSGVGWTRFVGWFILIGFCILRLALLAGAS